MEKLKSKIYLLSKNKAFRTTLTALALALICAFFVQTGCFATGAEGNITAQFSKLQSVVTTIVSSIGAIITLWGISEFGISLNEGQGMGQAQAFKRIAGGLVMILAPQILTLIS